MLCAASGVPVIVAAAGDDEAEIVRVLGAGLRRLTVVWWTGLSRM
jgi:hypothetical protein